MEEVYWTQRDGTRINVDQMTLTHLRNTLKMIIRNNQARIAKANEKPKFKLHGEIAQDHVAQMEDAEYAEDMGYDIY